MSKDPAQPQRLVGMFAFGEPNTKPTDENLGWQTRIEAYLGDGRYLVTKFSWLDGSATPSVIVSINEMREWEFYGVEEAWKHRAQVVMEQRYAKR